MSTDTWKTVAIVLLAVMVGCLLAGGGLPGRAHAQSEGQAGGVICLIGEEASQFAPIVVVDVPDQTIIVYEYSYRDDSIELTSARTFRFDRLLQEFQTDGVTVEEVRQFVQRLRP